MEPFRHASSDYFKTARSLAPGIAAAADRINSEREIPQSIVNEMSNKGLFRLLVPHSLGGAELNYLEYLEIVQLFAEIDGSTAWCVNQNNVFATNSARMPEKVAREIWGDHQAVVSNGPPTKSAVALPTEGGYNITGRWNFSSGSRHATWVAALVPIRSDNDAQVTTTEKEHLRIMLVPKGEIDLIDVWQVNGLRGTGSFSFQAKNLYVPNYRTYSPSDRPREKGPLYRIPTALLFASGFATVSLGIARASLNDAISVMGSKTLHPSRYALRNRTTTQRDIGKAEAQWNAARAFLLQSASTIWEKAQPSNSLSTDDRIRLRLASTHAIRASADIVNVAYNLCGSDSIFSNNRIQQRFQDIHVITQQVQGHLTHYDTAGQYFLGLVPDGQF